MKEFDGVFNRQDVVRLFLVDLVQDRRQRRGFAGTGRASYEHDAVPQFDDFTEMRWQIERCEIRDRLGDYAHHDRVSPTLPENVHSKTRDSWRPVGQTGPVL